MHGAASAAAADAGNSFFNRVLEKNGNGWLVGENITYADLALFHVVDGLSFAYVFPSCLPAASSALGGEQIRRRVVGLLTCGEDSFPKATKRALAQQDVLGAHYERVKARPNIKAYLESDRRQKYSKGLFRYYPELDG